MEGAHAARLAQAYQDARVNPLWEPLKKVLAKTSDTGGPSVNPALPDYILLITIMVAFLEAAAQKLTPQPPQLVMGFGGIQVPNSQPDEPT